MVGDLKYWRRLWLAPLLAGASTAANAQESSAGAENVPGRVYFDCHKYFGGGTEAGGSVQVSKHLAEDGSLLRMTVEWNDSVRPAPHGGRDHGITPLYGAVRDGWVNLIWLARPSGNGQRLDWEDPLFKVRLSGVFERFDQKKEPWRQIIIDRGDRLTVTESEGQRYIFFQTGLALMSSLDSSSGPGFSMPLRDLAAWSGGVEAVTVHQTRVARRKFNPNSYPNGPGPHRVVQSYKLSVTPMVETGRKVRKAIEQWEASITDFRTQCSRQVEEDDSQIIVT